jgi:hypothetical protein
MLVPHYKIEFNVLECENFIQFGIMPSVKEDKHFLKACAHGNLRLVRKLVNAGAFTHGGCGCALKYALKHGRFNIISYLIGLGAQTRSLELNEQQIIKKYIKNKNYFKILAAKRIYFWWIRRCYQMTTPSGIRMAFRNLAEHERLCAT